MRVRRGKCNGFPPCGEDATGGRVSRSHRIPPKCTKVHQPSLPGPQHLGFPRSNPAAAAIQAGRPPGRAGRAARAPGSTGVQVRVRALEVAVLGAVDLGLVLDGVRQAAGKAGFEGHGKSGRGCRRASAGAVTTGWTGGARRRGTQDRPAKERPGVARTVSALRRRLTPGVRGHRPPGRPAGIRVGGESDHGQLLGRPRGDRGNGEPTLGTSPHPVCRTARPSGVGQLLRIRGQRPGRSRASPQAGVALG